MATPIYVHPVTVEKLPDTYTPVDFVYVSDDGEPAVPAAAVAAATKEKAGIVKQAAHVDGSNGQAIVQALVAAGIMAAS